VLVCVCVCERERESGWVVRETTFNRGDRAKFMFIRAPRLCLLVFLVKVGWRGGKTFRCEEDRDEK